MSSRNSDLDVVIMIALQTLCSIGHHINWKRVHFSVSSHFNTVDKVKAKVMPRIILDWESEGLPSTVSPWIIA